MPGRPVISNCGTVTVKISEFVDFHLQPIVVDLPHVIKDTNDFLWRLRDLSDIPEGAILCTMDVVGLYPHIPHEEGLESIDEVMDEIFMKAGSLQSWLDKQDLVTLANDILENNYFEFNGNIYRQRVGTAIGTRFAPAFADIFMPRLERRMLKESLLKPWVWRRFLDDVFLNWLYGGDALIEFLNYVKSYHGQIKYTWECSDKQITYLQ